ncbi:type II toxin-antitoxin system CcdA family antitoxin [Trichlorobacter sp.]|uniref:type II toxin-antitoxin system CcdA family antitoxin n=1 Tax=Trichlorobacter sp. TaxID=2911007 RepID=UPI002A36C088|nr:type II toxin-antitoxin system CcdA family antitoxin [Trichlorobacter sp.]MDY0384052.1 type II toxin-antitoxin system CcdA family antitoxin [Trichlorobacter sp.]
MHNELDDNSAPQGQTKLSNDSELLRQHWQDQNREAVTEFNHYIEAHGCFSDGLRLF